MIPRVEPVICDFHARLRAYYALAVGRMHVRAPATALAYSLRYRSFHSIPVPLRFSPSVICFSLAFAVAPANIGTRREDTPKFRCSRERKNYDLGLRHSAV